MNDVVAGIEVEAALRARVSELEHRVSMLTAVLRLVLAIVRVSGFAYRLPFLASNGWLRPVFGRHVRGKHGPTRPQGGEIVPMPEAKRGFSV